MLTEIPKHPLPNHPMAAPPPIMFQCISNAVVQKQLIGSNDPGVCEVPKSWRCDRVGRAVIDIRIESVHNGTESTYIASSGTPSEKDATSE